MLLRNSPPYKQLDVPPVRAHPIVFRTEDSDSKRLQPPLLSSPEDAGVALLPPVIRVVDRAGLNVELSA